MNKLINLETIDIYRMIIATLRYCYTRNNHLEPSSTYSYVIKDLLPNFYKVDKDLAIHIAEQLCEECISEELNGHFYEGEEDENGNRKETINFINSLLAFIHNDDNRYRPYNYDLYERNIKLDDEKRYQIYEEDDQGYQLPVSEDLFSLKEYLDIIFDLLTTKELIYTKEVIPNKYNDFKYTIKEPVNKIFYIRNIKNDQNN